MQIKFYKIVGVSTLLYDCHTWAPTEEKINIRAVKMRFLNGVTRYIQTDLLINELDKDFTFTH